MSKRIEMKRLQLKQSVYPAVLAACVNRALEVTTSNRDVYVQLLGAVRARRWEQVARLADSLGMQLHPGVLDQYVSSQVSALVKKFPFTPLELPGFNPEEAAMKKFMSAEHRCRRVNQRSALLRYGVGFPHGEVLSLMKGYIRRVLGDKPNYTRIYDLCDWGPGANVGVTGDRTNFARKFLAKKWTVTRSALSYATRALWSNDQLRHILLREGRDIVCLDYELFVEKVRARTVLVTSNNINFVPKTFKTYRSIASEPLLNGFLQKGIDQYLRERLTAIAGLDLTDQIPNQEMARQGSLGGFNPYATLDLSSASDSMSTGIVKTLLPPEWFEFLNSARSHQYKHSGTIRTYEKFVSMGNGFCFPLQTLIFAAVCYASSITHGQAVDFRVYGDDIIVRQSLALHVMEVLRYIGFATNRDKTYVVGPFRESCGTDWHSGQDIRPVYVDFRLDSIQDLYKFHNSSLLRELTFGFFEPIRELVRDLCPPEFRLVRPFHGVPDGAFTVPRDIAMSSRFVSWDRHRWGWRWRELKTSAVADTLEGYDPEICNELRYIAVLRANQPAPVPLAVRRKARVSMAHKGYWGLPGDIAGVDTSPSRAFGPY